MYMMYRDILRTAPGKALRRTTPPLSWQDYAPVACFDQPDPDSLPPQPAPADRDDKDDDTSR